MLGESREGSHGDDERCPVVPRFRSAATPDHVRFLARWIQQLLDGPLGTDSDAVASGVGLALASARTGCADLARIADAVGCKGRVLAGGLTSLLDYSLVRRRADDLAPLLSPDAVPAPAESSERYVSVGVQVLAASAVVNRWRDARLVHVGAALLVLTTPSAIRPRRPAATWRVAGACGLPFPVTSELLRELALRHAAVGVDRHLSPSPIVCDGRGRSRQTVASATAGPSVRPGSSAFAGSVRAGGTARAVLAAPRRQSPWCTSVDVVLAGGRTRPVLPQFDRLDAAEIPHHLAPVMTTTSAARCVRSGTAVPGVRGLRISTTSNRSRVPGPRQPHPRWTAEASG